MINKIAELNKKIEKLMVEKTKADAQREVWSNKLLESIKAYENKYGVDLSGDSLDVIKEKLSAEISKVEKETLKDYEKAQKVVSLIEQGNIKAAWNCIGELPNEETSVGGNEEVSTPVHEVAEEPVRPVQPVQKDTQSVVKPVDRNSALADAVGSQVVEPPKFEGFLEEEEDDEGDFYGSEPVQENNKWSTLEEDDDEDGFYGSEPVQENKGASDFINSINGGGTPVIEEDDDDLDFGGFGSILKGSKFKVD